MKSAGAAGVVLGWAPPRGEKPAAYLVLRDGTRIARTKRRTFTDRNAPPDDTATWSSPSTPRAAGAAPRARCAPGSRRRSRSRAARRPHPFLPAAPAGPGPSPAPAGPAPGPRPGPVTGACRGPLDRRDGRPAVLARRLRPDAGRSATPGPAATHADLVDWFLNTPRALGADEHAAEDQQHAASRSTRCASDDELVLEWLDRMQRAVNPLPDRLAFFWHRHWAISRDDG